MIKLAVDLGKIVRYESLPPSAFVQFRPWVEDQGKQSQAVWSPKAQHHPQRLDLIFLRLPGIVQDQMIPWYDAIRELMQDLKGLSDVLLRAGAMIDLVHHPHAAGLDTHLRIDQSRVYQQTDFFLINDLRMKTAY